MWRAKSLRSPPAQAGLLADVEMGEKSVIVGGVQAQKKNHQRQILLKQRLNTLGCCTSTYQ